MASYGIQASGEFSPEQDNPVYGIKTGFWMSYATNFSLQSIYYTDGKKGTLAIRPEIGIGLKFFRLIYGYNLPVTNQHFGGINKHNLALNIHVNLFELKKKRKE